jgi:hypothetical protein
MKNTRPNHIQKQGIKDLIEYDEKPEIPAPVRIGVRLDSEYTDILNRVRILEGKSVSQVIRDALDCLEAAYAGNLYPSAIR